ncbi:alpha-hydroxy-acid oxidizing protein [Paraburkholderia panacisoli]|uniref:Alpha-hydroxy-acid oxidizing protein n=1 Tax=Paraburkholderia panacisoli TaxID=2603818 RepID=A0A5B0GNM3_9BURK|nr:alpha-hydroxy acid oxidase [Paraburkholderia panacisoli]KAA1003550.1 alpha-hydroxy-acid oxidizing protein [Paraburkholderia panacisoli]
MSNPIACIEDLRAVAERRIPRMFYDYVDSGSYTESTYRANEADLQQVRLRQRVGVSIDARKLETVMAGRQVAMPVALAPTGLAGMIRGNGEILAARAAQRFGVPFTLSTMSICSIEDVAQSVAAPFWFQLYVMRDRAFIERLIQRAAGAGCTALVVTMDLQVGGQRHKDVRNGLSTPPRITLANLLNMAARPAWSWGMVRAKRRHFGNIVGHVKGVDDMSSLASWVKDQFDPTMTWADIEWIRKLWKGKLIVKGILDTRDARRAVEAGADVIVVSNHGGRQLDGAVSSVQALPAIVDAVGERVEVWLDSGVRTGQDVLKAVALGARGTMIGRAFLYGLAAAGEAGVHKSLEIIAAELDTTMALCGCTDIAAVGPAILATHGA